MVYLSVRDYLDLAKCCLCKLTSAPCLSKQPSALIAVLGDGVQEVRLASPAPTLKICNFQTVKAMTTKFGDFHNNLSENILTSVVLVHHFRRFHGNHILIGMF